MTPDPIEAAAVECLSLADALPADCRRVVFVASILVKVPIAHPMRATPEHRLDEDGRPITVLRDHVYWMAERVRRGQVGAEELRAFVGELRAGRA